MFMAKLESSAKIRLWFGLTLLTEKKAVHNVLNTLPQPPNSRIRLSHFIRRLYKKSQVPLGSVRHLEDNLSSKYPERILLEARSEES
jgi:hypothetical protein